MASIIIQYWKSWSEANEAKWCKTTFISKLDTKDKYFILIFNLRLNNVPTVWK